MQPHNPEIGFLMGRQMTCRSSALSQASLFRRAKLSQCCVLSRGLLLTLLFGGSGIAQQARTLPSATVFMGQRVVIVTPSFSPEEHLPDSPARVCLVSTGTQCYTPPENNLPFGLDPTAHVLHLGPAYDALLFEVRASGGGSGSERLLALLRPGRGQLLINLLPPNVRLTEQGEYRFWSAPKVSAWALFSVADAVSGEGETHFARHRFVVKTYVAEHNHNYRLRDEYITASKYPSFDEVSNIRVLESERGEVLRRLRSQK
ncbi:MAG: hypothetical protein ACYC6M_05750 [Terriglobales bacterium]